MFTNRRVLVTILPFVATLTTAGVAFAADTGDTRRAASEACERVGHAAGVLQQQLDALERNLAQALTHTRAEIARELAPMMREWADRLGALARELERSQVGQDS